MYTACQSPRIAYHKPVEWTAGDDVEFLSAAYGLIPDEWQRYCLDVLTATNRLGRYTHGKFALAVPRQNGKNGILEMASLYFMVAEGKRLLHTAHEVKTARKAFLRVASFFENERKYPELAGLVKEIRKTNGQEAIILSNGGSVEFVARSRGSGRGYTVDVLIMDEAQELQDEQLEALLPTISAAPSGDPLQIYTGTPPGPKCPGTVFARLREQMMKKADKRLAWLEWSIPDEIISEKALKDWRELAYSTNPALGKRLNITTVSDERYSMDPDGFCRERLGRWDTDAIHTAIDMTDWEARLVESGPEVGRKVFGVKFSADGSEIALAGAIRPPGKIPHVEAIKWVPIKEGTLWLTDFLIKRKDETAAVVIDGKSGVGFLCEALKDAKFSKKAVIVPRVGEVMSAHSMFEQAIREGGVTFTAQQALMEQAKQARKRPIGKDGGFGWAAPPDKSVCLLDAATLAFYGAKTTKRNPRGTRGSRGARVL